MCAPICARVLCQNRQSRTAETRRLSPGIGSLREPCVPPSGAFTGRFRGGFGGFVPAYSRRRLIKCLLEPLLGDTGVCPDLRDDVQAVVPAKGDHLFHGSPAIPADLYPGKLGKRRFRERRPFVPTHRTIWHVHLNFQFQRKYLAQS